MATQSKTPGNPFVFVMGCPRSGTTLLQRMLDNHPDLTVANDTHFITRAVKKALRQEDNPRLTDELVRQVRSYRRFSRMGLGDEEIERAAASSRTYSQFVSRLYTERGYKHGKKLSGEKTPDFCRQVPVLNRLFPATRFVHIIRDGRDTALSAMNWATRDKGPGKWGLWETDPVACCALWWIWQTESGVRDGRALDSSLYHELKYEDLVADAPARLTTIAGFLGIPDAESMSRFFEGKTRDNPELSAKSAWLPPTRGLRDWRADMDEEDIAVFEGIAFELLELLDYELSGTRPGTGAIGRIDQALAWWDKQSMSDPA